MFILLTTIHVLVCLLLVVAVLLQSGKGGGLASAIGGGLSSSSVLGGRSAATFLSKATTILAAAFMVSCLTQAIIVRARHSEPVTATERMLQEQGAPPAQAPVPFGEGGVLPGEEAPAETASGGAQDEGAGAGGQEAAQTPAGQPEEGSQ